MQWNNRGRLCARSGTRAVLRVGWATVLLHCCPTELRAVCDGRTGSRSHIAIKERNEQLYGLLGNKNPVPYWFMLPGCSLGAVGGSGAARSQCPSSPSPSSPCHGKSISQACGYSPYLQHRNSNERANQRAAVSTRARAGPQGNLMKVAWILALESWNAKFPSISMAVIVLLFALSGQFRTKQTLHPLCFLPA